MKTKETSWHVSKDSEDYWLVGNCSCGRVFKGEECKVGLGQKLRFSVEGLYVDDKLICAHKPEKKFAARITGHLATVDED